MFKKQEIDTTALDTVITELYSEIAGFEGHEDEYDKTSSQIVKLEKLRHELRAGDKISKETWANVGANLLGILLVLHYEKLGVVTSKAFGFISKLR